MILFSNSKNIYKANMHCHTTVSDGSFSPVEIKEIYKNRGYSVIAFTDHDKLIAYDYLNDKDFLAINSIEVAINANMPGVPFRSIPCYHFNLYAVRPDMAAPKLPDMAYDDIDAINDYIKKRTDEGFLVCYNHPYWSMQTYKDYAGLKGCFAMEIYNHGCEVTDGYYGYNPQVYDEMLREGHRLHCFSTDDNHNWNKGFDDSFGGFININSESLSYKDIMDALQRGDFYSSQGPEIYEISIEDDILNIRCSPARLIVVYTIDRKCYTQAGTNLTEASFKLDGDNGYIRVMCRDKDKKDANSNAYFI